MNFFGGTMKYKILTAIAVFSVSLNYYGSDFSSVSSAGRGGVYVQGENDSFANPSLPGLSKNYYIGVQYYLSSARSGPSAVSAVPFSWGVWSMSFSRLSGDNYRSLMFNTGISKEVFPFFLIGISADYYGITLPGKGRYLGGSFGLSYSPAVFNRGLGGFGLIEPQIALSFKTGKTSGENADEADIRSADAILMLSVYKDSSLRMSMYGKGAYSLANSKTSGGSGLELSYKEMLKLRGGLLFCDPLSYDGWTAGAGMSYKKISVDYAFEKSDENIHRFSVSAGFLSVDVNPPEVNLRADPAFISPDHDGRNDYSVVNVSAEDRSGIKGWIFQIKSADGSIVKEYRSDQRFINEPFGLTMLFKRVFLPGSGMKVPAAFLWDGTDSSGSGLSDGAYSYSFICWDEFNNYSEKKTGYVIIDTNRPSAEITASELLFSPNGDGKKDFIAISQKSVSSGEDLWTGVFYDQNGFPVRKFEWKGGSVPAVLKWDGKNDSGMEAPEGLYSYVLSGSDNAANTAEKKISEITLTRAYESADVKSIVSLFSYNTKASILFSPYLSSLGGLVRWNLNIQNGSGDSVRKFEGSGSFSGGIEWDALDQKGNRLSDGKYYYSFGSEFTSGNTPRSFSKEIVFDSTEPSISVTCSPLPFSPDGDGENDIMRINPSADDLSGIKNWEITIMNPTGHMFRRFVGQGRVPGEIVWDGRSGSGELVESAEDYTVSLTAVDNCGNTASTPGFKVPVDILVVVTERGLKIKISSIEFSFGSGKLTSRGRDVLDRVAVILRKYPAYFIMIEGHTDDVGEEQYNLRLSEQRAKSVYDYLVEKGTDAERLNFRGMGETMPYLPNKDEETRRKNRRVEFLLERKGD